MNSAATIPLDTLSVTEKLVLMERLWEELSRRPVEIPVPDWHGDILAERLANVRDGKTAFVDWDEAKQRLRERLQ